MRHLIIAIFLLNGIHTLHAQQLTFVRARDLYTAENVCDLKLTGCDWRPMVSNSTNFLGYAHHPNGQLWLVIDEEYDPILGYHKIKIFDTNTDNCQYTLLYSIDLPQYWSCDAALNVDFNGSLYLNLNEWDEINNTSFTTISRIADPSNPIIERLLILEPDQYPFEILFQNQKVYLVEANRNLIYVYNNDFEIQDTIIMKKHICGLSAISYGCDSVVTYAVHQQYNTAHYATIGWDTVIHISTYDIEADALTFVCDYFPGNKEEPTTLTSPLEFLASDPECDLLIDLDRNNSTGVYPYDYLDSNIYCTKLEVPVSDEDTYIHTSAPLDSIRLILSGILDITEEHLIMQPIPPGISFTMLNDSIYLITSSNPTDSLYTEALRSIYYLHNGISLSEGTRTIIIQGFNAIKSGVLVKSYIHLEGIDETFLFSTTCQSSQVGTFVTTYLNQHGCDSLVTQIVSLVPADTTVLSVKTCDPDLIGNVETNYTNQEGCDSLVIQQTTLHTLPELNVLVTSDFNGYSISCFGESDGSAIAEGTGIYPWSYLWSTGSTAQSITDLGSGTYGITITDANGCTSSNEVLVNEPQAFAISFVVSEPKCFDGQDGSIIVQASGGVQPTQYSINGLGYQTSPLFNNLSGGTYTVSAVDANGCETKEIIWINVPLELNVDLGDDQMILEGDTAILNAIVNVPFDSLSEITWSGLIGPNCPDCLTQAVAPIITTTYSVLISSNIGCIDEDAVTVFVKNENTIYIPNVFTPNGDGINDVLVVYGGSGVEKISSFEIFNRWGTLVHSANNIQSTDVHGVWDGRMKGKDLNPGVFAYKVIAEFKDGSSVVKYGDITLIR